MHIRLLIVLTLIGCGKTIPSSAPAQQEVSAQPLLSVSDGKDFVSVGDTVTCKLPASSSNLKEIYTKTSIDFFNKKSAAPRLAVSVTKELETAEYVVGGDRSKDAQDLPGDEIFCQVVRESTDGKIIKSQPSASIIVSELSPTIGTGTATGATNSSSNTISNIDPSKVCIGQSIGSVAGTATCISGSLTAPAATSEILAGTNAYGQNGSVLTGTMVNRGALNPTQSFPGAGYFSGLSTAPAQSNICSGSSLLGTSGTATCLSGSLSNAAIASEIVSGKAVYASNGSVLTGSMANRGTWNLTTTFPGTGYFAGVSNAPSASQVCSGANVAGVNGTANCSANFASLMGSGLHRDKGGTPTQLTIASENSNTDLPSGYREVPDFNKDDDGSSSTSVDRVVRGTNVWNSGVTRKACGMGLAAIQGRISDCDSRHVTKPSWDTNTSDGKISWNGSMLGNSSEGEWTLVTVYNPSLSNGDTCNSSCREVWRDDRTGLLWSDRLGSLTAAYPNDNNQSNFNWCRAAGVTSNPSPTASDCRKTQTGSLNYLGLSLCTEASGLLTPNGIPSSSQSDSPTWVEADTSIRDSKGGMLKTTNTDPIGSAQSPSVRWRLPTKSDWLIAEVNGGRFVLPNLFGTTSAAGFWSATNATDDPMLGPLSGKGRVWIFHTTYSQLASTNVREQRYWVRCIGRFQN